MQLSSGRGGAGRAVLGTGTKGNGPEIAEPTAREGGPARQGEDRGGPAVHNYRPAGEPVEVTISCGGCAVKGFDSFVGRRIRLGFAGDD